jgi:hypothetical protein
MSGRKLEKKERVIPKGMRSGLLEMKKDEKQRELMLERV